jgi:hypothetical protein
MHFVTISAQMLQALEADKAEAALDNSIWGLLEWKWQVSNNDLFKSVSCL